MTDGPTDVQILSEGDGDQAFAAVIRRHEERAATVSAVFPMIIWDFWETEKRRFAHNGYGTWRPLAASTVANRKRQGSDPSKILQVTGALLDSLTSQTEHTIMRLQPEEMFIGSNRFASWWHQTGGYVKDRPPMRKPIDISASTRVRWAAILQRWLAGSDNPIAELPEAA